MSTLERSRKKNYTHQQALVASYARKIGVPYEASHVLDTAVAIFMEYVQSGLAAFFE